jgi:hypothetical protein
VKHESREVSTNIAGRHEPPRMWHDVTWRLDNLGFFTGLPYANDPGPQPSPLRVTLVADAMLRFKAKNHEALHLVDWLDGPTSKSAHRLTGDQDDASVALLLFQHDYLAVDAASDKVDDAKKGNDPL